MPTVTVDKERLFTALGRPHMTVEEFDELCFEYGVELDEVTSERELLLKDKTQAADGTLVSDRTLLKIDVSANRYDLLCEEGLARALRIFLGVERPPVFRAIPAKGAAVRFNVKQKTRDIRPFVVGAVLRNVTLDQAAYDSFIELQEKLHSGLCRRRVKVAIGTHDLDTIHGPFTYDALPPKDISFVPLNQTTSMDGADLMEFYEGDRRLSKFLPIIRDAPRYPVIYDRDRTVLSLPPIINGQHSKITLHTRNILIECTATEEPKARTVLNMVVGMFSEYCKDKFSVEQVEVVYENDPTTILRYPDFTPRTMTATVAYINSCIGTSIHLSNDQILQYLAKMGLVGRIVKECGEDAVQVDVPITRSDVLHACDVMEDVAVAYGINRIPKTVPNTNTVAGAFPLNKLSDMVRRELALAGWSEVLPLTLCSHAENYAYLMRTDPGNEAVVLANPKTIEYEVVRTSLLPGILKTAASNKKCPLPIRIFEVSDVVLQDPSAERRTRNERRMCVLYSNRESGFELIHGVLDRIMAMLEVPLAGSADVTATQKPKSAAFSIRPSAHATYFPGRQADVLYNGKPIGSFGIVHPLCLEKFELSYPCSCLEINIEPFL